MTYHGFLLTGQLPEPPGVGGATAGVRLVQHTVPGESHVRAVVRKSKCIHVFHEVPWECLLLRINMEEIKLTLIKPSDWKNVHLRQTDWPVKCINTRFTICTRTPCI